ncbi:MAG: hypothetical protein IJ532_02685 [Alphaproteobacteria bacterium]|nr:hypothetical protein [Alphaproteobacteria bacterium]
MSVAKKVCQDIKVKHYKSEEETEDGKIKHNFVCFDAGKAELKNISSAKTLAKNMGEKVFPFLQKLSENIKDEKVLQQCQKTTAWVHKKAVWHPALVEKCTHQLLEKMKKSGTLKKMSLSYRQVYTDTSVAAILHDIGRLSEVDIAQGSVNMKRSGLNKNHSAISFDILEHAQIKPEILLAIKYHEFADVNEVQNDELYKKLKQENQKIADFYTHILQDMDKTANLTERSVFGIKKCAEFFDPHYIQDYGVTEEHFINAINGNYLRLKGGHLLDAMMRFVTWTYCIHFSETKEILAEVLTKFFAQMYDEAEREYNNSTEKNQAKLADTLEKIMQLEAYAISERMKIKLDKRQKEAISARIKELKA